MKKIILFLFLIVAMACGDSVVKKPEKLIDENVMVDIFYDLALMDAVRTQYPKAFTERNLNPDKYIYTKYKIDSTQFAQSNRYYASQIKTYKKMYERVDEKLKKESGKLNPKQATSTRMATLKPVN